MNDIILLITNVSSDHELNDLEEVLDEALQLDFNVQAEDDSPYMVCV